MEINTLIVYGTIEITKIVCLTALAMRFEHWWIVLFYILIRCNFHTEYTKTDSEEGRTNG